MQKFTLEQPVYQSRSINHQDLPAVRIYSALLAKIKGFWVLDLCCQLFMKAKTICSQIDCGRILKVEPELSNREAICEELLKAIRQSGGELVKSWSDRFTQLVFQYFPFEEEIINFLFCRGFVHTESVYTLTRDLTDPIPDVLFPPGIQIQHWKMERQVEKQQYVEARNRAFPESQITVDDWNYFLHSPLMEVGMNFGAFDGEELIGCITVFWDEKQNKLSGEQVGSTEYLFVTPAWRGLGLGRCLLAQGMHYLKKQGMIKAQLEVRASNAGALGLYTKLGYKITRESWFLVNSL